MVDGFEAWVLESVELFLCFLLFLVLPLAVESGVAELLLLPAWRSLDPEPVPDCMSPELLPLRLLLDPDWLNAGTKRAAERIDETISLFILDLVHSGGPNCWAP